MRADRLLAALLHLQANGRMTGRELAHRLEVSARTIHRDMEALSAAGVPIYALRGARGGWQLDENWRTQVPGLDEAELHALLMAQPRSIGDPRLTAAAERAIGKLMASLPTALRDRANSIRQRLHVDTNGWRGTTEDLSQLPVVQDAVSRDRKLSMGYRRGDGERVERIVDPLGLVAKGNAWYLVADTENGFRTYRVSRMEGAVVLEQASRRPPNFDLAAYWQASTAQFQESRPRFDATLRLDPRAADWVKHWRVFSPVASEHAEGWLTLCVQFDSEEEACFVAMGLGTRVEVVDPESLRERIAANVTALIERAVQARRAAG